MAATGAIRLFKTARVSIWLVIASALSVLYGAMFLVMGGVEDESRGYALMVLAVAGSAYAQETREQEREALQAQKAAQLRPYEPTQLERRQTIGPADLAAVQRAAETLTALNRAQQARIAAVTRRLGL